jgi:hypothetical protein
VERHKQTSGDAPPLFSNAIAHQWSPNFWQRECHPYLERLSPQRHSEAGRRVSSVRAPGRYGALARTRFISMASGCPPVMPTTMRGARALGPRMLCSPQRRQRECSARPDEPDECPTSQVNRLRHRPYFARDQDAPPYEVKFDRSRRRGPHVPPVHHNGYGSSPAASTRSPISWYRPPKRRRGFPSELPGVDH